MKTSIVITSINQPTTAVEKFADYAQRHGWSFYLIGDSKGPTPFQLEGCTLLTLDDQRKLDFRFAQSCPTRHYARKNIGYLLALRDGVERLYETDDDNIPYESFYAPESPNAVGVDVVEAQGSVNAYRYFTSARIWPRGLPLEAILPSYEGDRSLPQGDVESYIYQGLADQNPDVDAIFRLTHDLPIDFDPDKTVALKPGAWCPFNSQNTTWLPPAFPLLYLPAYCSFRMTDIWRSFVAQRICWANGWSLVFHSSTVYQERNEHNLLKDFEDEVPGYLHNPRIIELLGGLDIAPGIDRIADNMRLSYQALIREQLVGTEEEALLEDWLADVEACRKSG